MEELVFATAEFFTELFCLALTKTEKGDSKKKMEISGW